MGVGRSRRRREMDRETEETEAELGEASGGGRESLEGSESLDVDIQSLLSYLIRR